MYKELTSSVQNSALNWKPSSFHSLGPLGHVLALPAVGAQMEREIRSEQSLVWLGQPLTYSPSWDDHFDASFEAATASWNANRRWLFNRRLTLRSRLRMFASSVVSILVTRICHLPCHATVLQRVRRWENRCLRSLVGATHSFAVPGEFSAITRKVRKIAAKAGHIDVVTMCLRRHFALAGQWARLPADASDLAMSDFKRCWRTALSTTWQNLRTSGVRRIGPGRPRAQWDSYLDLWSKGMWPNWALCQHTWSDLEDEWVVWALRQVGVSMAEIPSSVLCRGLPPHIADHGNEAYCISALDADGICIVSDCLVLVRTMQGRWCPRTPWLTTFVCAANDYCESIMPVVPFCSSREGWWLSHTSRRANVWSDTVSKFARDTMHPVCLWVHDAFLWSQWSRGFLGGRWYLSTDGSARPEPPYARGLCGASATLWHWSRHSWLPIATLAASSQWAAAVESESTALQLALVLLQPTRHVSEWVSVRALLCVENLDWLTEETLRSATGSPTVLGAHAFAHLVSMPALPTFGLLEQGREV